MGRRAKKNPRVRADQRAAAVEREALERRWFPRLVEAPSWARWVTFAPNLQRPRHRWLPYRQGLARELVDAFIDDAGCVDGPVLDPFAGSGTVPLGAAERGRDAVGVDAVPPLACLLRAKASAGPLPRWTTPLGEARALRELPRPTSLLHVGAMLAAAGRTVDGSGRQCRDRRPETSHLAEVLRQITEDLASPVPGRVLGLIGDARRLPLADASVGGALTSPPYVARYDYTDVNRPLLALWQAWHGGGKAREAQLRGDRGGRGGGRRAAHPAAAEGIERLREAGERKLAGVVAGHLDDMDRALAELARVLRPGAPCWLVVAGAAPRKVYLPLDLVLAEMAEAHGLRCEQVTVARTLTERGRALGGLGSIDPRESVLQLRRDADR